MLLMHHDVHSWHFAMQLAADGTHQKVGTRWKLFQHNGRSQLDLSVRLLEGYAHYASFFHGVYTGFGSSTKMWLMSGSSSP